MSIYINKDTRVITQGITGKTGQFHTRGCRDYANGKNCFVAGVNPKKAGEDFEGIPIFANVTDAAKATGATVSVPHMLQEQADHLTWIVRQMREQCKAAVEATEDAEAGWQTVIAGMNEARRPFQESCTPGYFNAEGKPEDRRSAIGSGMYFPSTAFFRMLAEWREAGNFAGLELR